MIARLLSAPLLLAVLAVAMGSGIDALVKATAPGAGVMVLVAWRFLFGAMIAGAVFLLQRRPWPPGEAVRFHIMRSLMQVASAILLFHALTQLALAETVLIGFRKGRWWGHTGCSALPRSWRRPCSMRSCWCCCACAR